MVRGKAALMAAVAVLTVGGFSAALVLGVLPKDSATTGPPGAAVSPSPSAVAAAPPTPAPTPTPVAVQYPAPAHLAIPAIGVDAPVVPLGLDADAIPEIPSVGSDTGWYNFSARPGQGSNVVIAGHLQLHQVPAVFWRLDELQPGDLIQITSDSGQRFAYQVTSRRSVSSTEPDSVKVIYPTGREMLTLITCGGTWIANPSQTFGGDFSSRTVVQAVPVTSG